jgi:hypothetical protein
MSHMHSRIRRHRKKAAIAVAVIVAVAVAKGVPTGIGESIGQHLIGLFIDGAAPQQTATATNGSVAVVGNNNTISNDIPTMRREIAEPIEAQLTSIQSLLACLDVRESSVALLHSSNQLSQPVNISLPMGSNASIGLNGASGAAPLFTSFPGSTSAPNGLTISSALTQPVNFSVPLGGNVAAPLFHVGESDFAASFPGSVIAPSALTISNIPTPPVRLGLDSNASLGLNAASGVGTVPLHTFALNGTTAADTITQPNTFAVASISDAVLGSNGSRAQEAAPLFHLGEINFGSSDRFSLLPNGINGLATFTQPIITASLSNPTFPLNATTPLEAASLHSSALTIYGVIAPTTPKQSITGIGSSAIVPVVPQMPYSRDPSTSSRL